MSHSQNPQGHSQSATAAQAHAQNIEQLIASLRTNSQPQIRLAAMNSLLRELRASKSEAYTRRFTEDIVRSLRACLTDPGKEIRANAFRILRHIISGEGVHALSLAMALGIDIFIVRALTRDNRFDLEREQAVKLVRASLDHEGAVRHLSPGLVRMLVALAESPDDKLRVAALETVCEIAVYGVDVAAPCGGVRVIFGALSDARARLASIVVATSVFLIDSSASRAFVRPEVELEAVISCLTDTMSPPDRIRSCVNIVSMFLRTWTGITYLSMNSKRSFKSIIDCLHLPSDACRAAVLEMLFDLLGLSAGGSAPFNDENNGMQQLSGGKCRLFHYQCVLLVIFIDVGLLEALCHIVHCDNKQIATLATVLAAEIQKLSESLPAHHASRVQAMSSLFEMASNFSNEVDRHCATGAFTHIDSFYEQAAEIRFADVKEVVGGQIEDAQFRLTVAEAEKIFNKDSSKWNWDFIYEFLQILLNNSRRAEEVLKGTKILKRLLSFFKPVGSGFGVPDDPNLEVMTVTGCYLMRVLLSCGEGVKLLSESKFMMEIADEFNKLDEVNGPLSADALFGRNRVANNSSGLYFNFLAELSHSPSGISILSRYKIFNMYYLITELHNREDLITALIRTMDFSTDGHERVILSKLMTCTEKEIRSFSTDFVGNLLLTNGDEGMKQWCVEVLVTQMYDPNKDIRVKAKTFLESACELPGVVAAILDQNPVFHLDSYTYGIFMRFLRLPAGFEYLQSNSYVESEMNYWIQFGIFNYVTRIELSLDELCSKSFGPTQAIPNLPLHFYGELAKTEPGLEYLANSGHFDTFVNVIRDNNQSTLENFTCLKACLWAVGHIGSSSLGMSLLKESRVIGDITRIASTSRVLSLRGTCVYVLSLLGKSTEGIDALSAHNWEVFPAIRNFPIALPCDISTLIEIEPWVYKGDAPLRFKNKILSNAQFDQVELDIIKNIGTLSNHIVAKQASKQLARLRMEQPHYFTKLSLYIHVMAMLSRMHYRLTVRRFIQELFEKVALDDETFDRWFVQQ